MLIRLSLQNARRTFGNYIIYVLTVSLMIALDLMLNRLIFSNELMNGTEASSGMKMIFGFATVIMLLVLFALIKYMTRFILNRRSKEFGLYQLMGIEDKQITRIYWIEQCYLGGISLLLGILVGLLAGEILRSILFNYVGCIEYHFTLQGIGNTIILTVLETFGAYLMVKLFSRKLFRKRNIISWLQAERKNEVIKKNGIVRYMLTVFWITVAVAAFVILAVNENNLSTALIGGCSAALLIATFGFATCLVRIISDVLLKKDNQYTLRVLPVRFVSKRIATRSRQMGIMAVLFVFAMGIMAVGMLFGNYIHVYSDEYSGFDFYYSPLAEDGATEEFILGMEHVLSESGIKSHCVIEGYAMQSRELRECYDYEGSEMDVISLSTYNRVREMLGNKPVTLEMDEFIIQTHIQLVDARERFNKTEYELDERSMKLKSIEMGPLSTMCVADGSPYYAVVSDELLMDKEPVYYSYAYQLEDKNYKELRDKMDAYVIENAEDIENALIIRAKKPTMSYDFCFTQAIINESSFTFAATAIALMFMGVVFALVLSTVLAILLTSEVNENKQRFLTLHRLGAGKRMQEVVLKQQITSLFSMPVIIGLPLVAAVCLMVGKSLESVMTFGYLFSNMFFTIAGFLAIYAIYMLATYKTLNKSVIEEK